MTSPFSGLGLMGSTATNLYPSVMGRPRRRRFSGSVQPRAALCQAKAGMGLSVETTLTATPVTARVKEDADVVPLLVDVWCKAELLGWNTILCKLGLVGAHHRPVRILDSLHLFFQLGHDVILVL